MRTDSKESVISEQLVKSKKQNVKNALQLTDTSKQVEQKQDGASSKSAAQLQRFSSYQSAHLVLFENVLPPSPGKASAASDQGEPSPDRKKRTSCRETQHLVAGQHLPLST